MFNFLYLSDILFLVWVIFVKVCIFSISYTNFIRIVFLSYFLAVNLQILNFGSLVLEWTAKIFQRDCSIVGQPDDRAANAKVPGKLTLICPRFTASVGLRFFPNFALRKATLLENYSIFRNLCNKAVFHSTLVFRDNFLRELGENFLVQTDLRHKVW